jgi:hypothetical protein
MPIVRRIENGSSTGGGASPPTDSQLNMPNTNQGKRDRSSWLPKRDLYLQFRQHLPKQSIDQENPFDQLRFVKEIRKEQGDAVCSPLASEFRRSYLPYAEEFLSYSESLGLPKEQLLEKYKLIIEVCRKSFEDLVLSVIERKGRSEKVGASNWDSVAIETMAGMGTDNGVILFNNFKHMLAFHGQFEYFANHQFGRLKRYALGQFQVYPYSYVDPVPTMEWLSNLTGNRSEYQKYYDSRTERYADLLLTSLPSSGPLPHAQINLVAKEMISLVMGSLELEEGNSKLVSERISRLYFCHPEGGQHYSGQEILETYLQAVSSQLDKGREAPQQDISVIAAIEIIRSSELPDNNYVEVSGKALEKCLPQPRSVREHGSELFQAIARDISGSGPEDAFQAKLRTKYGKETRLPDLQLQSLGLNSLQIFPEPASDFLQKSSKPSAFAHALMTAREAIEQVCTSLNNGTAEAVADKVSELKFSSEQGPFQKSGADILSYVVMLSSAQEAEKTNGRDDYIKGVEIVRAAYLNSESTQSTMFLQNKHRTCLDAFKVSMRELQQNEKRCYISGLEEALRLELPTAEDYIRKMKLKVGSVSYVSEHCQQYREKVSAPFRELSYRILKTFLRAQKSTDITVYTNEWPDLRIATSDGKVIFESLTNFLYSVKQINTELCVEEARLKALLSGIEEEKLVVRLEHFPGGIEMIALAQDMISETDKNINKLKAQYSHKMFLPDFHLRSLSSGQPSLSLQPNIQPNISFVSQSKNPAAFYKALTTVNEAINEVYGSLHQGSKEEIAYALLHCSFISRRGDNEKRGADLLSDVAELSPGFKKKKPNRNDIVNAVDIVRAAYSQNSEDTQMSSAPIKENIFKLHFDRIRQNFRIPEREEDVFILHSLEKLLNVELLDLVAFRRLLKDGKIQLTQENDLLTAYEDKVVTLFHDRCESVLIEFLIGTKPGNREIYSYDWPNLRLATAEGKVAFESFGHFLSFIQKLNQEFLSQISKLKSSGLQENTSDKYSSPLKMLAKVQDYDRALVKPHHHQDLIDKYRERGLPHLHLRSLSDNAVIDVKFNPEILSKSQDPEQFKKIVAAVAEAISQVMGSLMSGTETEVAAALSNLIFSDPEAKNYISGHSLLCRVEDAKGSIVSLKRAVRIVRNALKSEMQPLEQDLLSVIPKDLHIPSGALFLALCALNNQQNTSKAFNAFEMRFTKVMESKPQQVAIKKAPLAVFQQVVELALGSTASVDVESISINYLSDLLHQICVRSFDGNIKRIIEELEKHRDPVFIQQTDSRRAVLTHIFEQVVPALEARYRRQLTCQIPDSIKMTPYGHQRDAAIGAAFLDKPIMVMEPGTGKTLSLAITLEMLGPEGGLWVTKPAVREQTKSHLANDIFIGKRVAIISSEDARKSLDGFRKILENADYLVVGYDSIRILHRKHPQAFAALNDWLITRRCVLDEAHLIDKRSSGKSKAVLELKALVIKVASGTPYQHDDARVATLLHIVRPDIFPDPVGLEAFFRKNPGAARTTLHAYSSVFSIEDVALPFEDPKKIPFAEQLSGGIPRVPTMVTHRNQYALSLEHSATYVDLVLNYQQWAARNHTQISDNRRAVQLRRLVSYPEQMGLSKPQALIDAIKQIALPVVESGGKVLVLSYRKHPLHLLAEDPEIRSYGAVALDGDQSTEERTKLVIALEENSSVQIGLGQMSAVGSGFNIRSVSCVIVLDRPLQSSELSQALRRPIRLLGAGDERFAREKVNVHFLEASLDQQALKMLSEHERAALGNETIYQKLLSRSLHDLERFRSFVVRGESGASPQPSLEAIISKLEANHRHASHQLQTHQLMSDRVAAGRVAPSVLRYNTPAKNRWRTEELGAFVSENISKLARPVDQLQVVVLAGPEGLEIPIYIERGILASNIHVFEGSKNKDWQQAVRAMAKDFGAPFYASPVERVLPFMDKKFDIFSIDPDGYTTPALALMFALLPMNDSAMILKNTMAAREKGEAKDMIREVDYRRDLVDAKIIKLLGTKSLAELNSLSAVALIREVSRVRAVARTLTPMLEQELQVSPDLALEFLVELALGSPHTKALKQGRYITPGGTPFHHSFALVQRWSADIIETEFAQEVQKLFKIQQTQIGAASRIRPPELSAALLLSMKRHAMDAIKYFKEAVPQEFWLSRLH